jgi:hypothetical protein
VRPCVGFLPVLLEKLCRWFSLSGFPINRTRVLCLYRFSASFPYKLANFPLLNEKAELLPVAPKKKKKKKIL